MNEKDGEMVRDEEQTKYNIIVGGFKSNWILKAFTSFATGVERVGQGFVVEERAFDNFIWS